jgi:inorganic pyrophosphatase
MRVLIENEAGSSTKHSYDERSLALVGSAQVSAAYPYAYGFAIGTRSGDGDAVDCFVLGKTPFKSGSVIECEPLALLEQIEDGEIDHKVLAAPTGEEVAIDDAVLERLTAFVQAVFAHVPGKTMQIGRLLDRQAAEDFLERCRIEAG